MFNSNPPVQLTNAPHSVVKFIKGPNGQWRGRIEIGPDRLNNIVLFTVYCSSRLEVIHEAERQVKAFMTPDTADLDTQPVIVPDDENGEDTIITRRELDEGR